MGLYGIVLASGQSVRMGGKDKPKLHLSWRGISILEHVLNKISAAVFQSVNVVIPHHDACLRGIVHDYGHTAIMNYSPESGMGHSLSLGIRSLPIDAEAVILFLGDQPTISTTDIKAIRYVFQQMRAEHEYCPKAIIQMKYRDGKVGHPILFSHHFFSELSTVTGDKGGRDIIRANFDFLILCESKHIYPEDIDTPLDYKKLLKGDIPSYE
ncbi:nucleotidyltransferase family protein [Oceanobacillus indicireducens]|uniref:Molybdopterin-guanine dinucleotide biosynthesis protein A n=1 Tax=Oceanobacillus indicireducens TaxID=1004261 RepID=A0A918D4X7_9BACI|nr:nucleotidyltransferase family protein [Oceanobacillus indicireducens]GGN64806.1 molybdopterin-guanine dinucleotide biosynthesis protein A [Oceanobacillus indicireducens]